MLEGMEHVKCCGNCVHFLVLDKECNRGDIGSSYIQCPEFYYCDEFELSQIDIDGSTVPNIDYNGDFQMLDGNWNDGLPNKPTKIPMPPVKPPKKSELDKDKLIHNMARYIAKQDIDSEICAPVIRQGGCLIEKEHANGVDCGLDMCIECVKNWFSRE